MKTTPEEARLRKNFSPGTLTKAGFMGDDSRHIHDIIEADIRKVRRLGLSVDRIADRLQWFIDEGKKGLERPVDLGTYIVTVQWRRGMIPCPFGERGLHHKLIATVTEKETGELIRFSQLNVHMIRDHGFFEGEGGLFRIDPERMHLFFHGCPLESQEESEENAHVDGA